MTQAEIAAAVQQGLDQYAQYDSNLNPVTAEAGKKVLNVELNSGTATIGTVAISQTTPGTTNGVQVNAALPSGTNAIGKLAANSGVDIGDVDVLSIGGTPPDSDNAARTNVKVLPTGGVAVDPTALTTYAAGDAVQANFDLNGAQLVNPGNLSSTTDSVTVIQGESGIVTYSAATGSVTAAGTPTDVSTLTGSASKVIRLQKVRVTMLSTANANYNVFLVKRALANTAGTSADVTEVAHDSADGAATATVLSYTANPTINSTVGNLRSDRSFSSAIVTAVYQSVIEWTFSEIGKKAPILRGITEVFAVNFNGATTAGLLYNVDWEWTEADA